MDTYFNTIQAVQRLTGVEQGSSYMKRDRSKKDEEKRKYECQDQERKEEESNTTRPFAIYDACARKVTIYPFRSNGIEA